MTEPSAQSEAAERFAQAATLFDRAMTLTEAEREGFIAEACGDDAALADEVGKLVRAAGGGDPFASVMPSPAGDLLAQEPATSHTAGDRIGNYTVERLLGSGGFGEVYLARQHEPIERTVAVKIVRAGLSGDTVLERFERERRTLALMEHPGIARVFDAGIAASGRPYVVMEYVAGPPIDEYCDSHGLSIDQRVRMIAELARALHHAHQRGVIHRDLKPSNVLVAEVDGEPVPKLIDFGIAKATELTGAPIATMTAVGALIGTPQYMSPEQAAGREVDTRSDVYSLGALAFRVLAGDTPIAGAELKAMSVPEILQRIASMEPPRVSDRVAQLGPEQSLETRSLDPTRLRSRLRGDLDWILGKAMMREPERRYEAASDFARDLERHLDNEPVEAGPPSMTYRVARFAARNRAVVIAGGLTTAALVLGLVGTTIGFLRAEAALDTAEAERDATRAALMEAERQQQLTAEINAFFSSEVFAAADPFTVPDPDQSVIAALERALSRLDDQFEQEPLIEAEIRRSAASILDALGRTEEARAEITRAIEIYLEHGSPDSVNLARARGSLGSIFGKLGRYDEAIDMTLAAIEVLKDEFGEDSYDVYNRTNELVYTLTDLGRLDEAERVNGVLLEAVESGRIDGGTLAVNAYSNAGAIAYKRSEPVEAEPWFRRAYEVCLEAHGSDHPDTINTLSSLAVLVQRNGDAEGSLPMHTDAVAGATRTLGRDHPYTQTIRNNRGLALAALGRYEEAQAVFAELLAMRTEQFGETHPDTLVSMITVARNLGRLGRFDEAERMGLRGYELFRQELGPDHFATDRARGTLAEIYRLWGRANEADRWSGSPLENDR